MFRIYLILFTVIYIICSTYHVISVMTSGAFIVHGRGLPPAKRKRKEKIIGVAAASTLLVIFAGLLGLVCIMVVLWLIIVVAHAALRPRTAKAMRDRSVVTLFDSMQSFLNGADSMAPEQDAEGGGGFDPESGGGGGGVAMAEGEKGGGMGMSQVHIFSVNFCD